MVNLNRLPLQLLHWLTAVSMFYVINCLWLVIYRVEHYSSGNFQTSGCSLNNAFAVLYKAVFIIRTTSLIFCDKSSFDCLLLQSIMLTMNFA